MITTLEAQKLVSEFLPKWQKSQAVKADRDYPPFHRVMMDGIALKLSDYEKGLREFKIEGVCAAGDAPKTLHEGCLEVMTGACLPENADLVIQYEHLKIQNGVAQIIEEIPRSQYESVHLMGSDCKEGETVLGEDLFLNGPHMGIRASMGDIKTSRPPKVMIISTGDELVEDHPLPHQIRRSNAHALKTSLLLSGLHDVTLDHLSDDEKIVSDHYKKNAPLFDLMIYSGGVSKGKFDYLPKVWEDSGVTKHFHGVAQRPGKPLWFGTDSKTNTTVIGLPGNPVSSLVCLHRYFLPLREMSAKLSIDFSFHKKLTYFIPVKVTFSEGVMWATPLTIKNSGEFTALAESDGLLELPADQNEFKQGESFRFIPWRNF